MLYSLTTGCNAASPKDANAAGPVERFAATPRRPLPATCVKGYANRNAATEAAAGLKSGDTRFFTAFTDGAYRGYNVPALDKCYDQKRLADRRRFRDLGNPSGGDGVHFPAEDKCESEALAFAARYNHIIARAAPRSIADNCGPLATERLEK